MENASRAQRRDFSRRFSSCVPSRGGRAGPTRLRQSAGRRVGSRRTLGFPRIANRGGEETRGISRGKGEKRRGGGEIEERRV